MVSTGQLWRQLVGRQPQERLLRPRRAQQMPATGRFAGCSGSVPQPACQRPTLCLTPILCPEWPALTRRLLATVPEEDMQRARDVVEAIGRLDAEAAAEAAADAAPLDAARLEKLL